LKRLATNLKWGGNPLRWISLLVLFLVPSRAVALNPTKSVSQYTCRSWARQNGLPANAVLAIAQTRDGYLWLGTPRGLVRFDGEEFKLFEMAHIQGVRSTIVTSLAQARGGGLWFGVDRGGFGFCDGRNLSLLGSDDRGGRSLVVHSVEEAANGDLWIGAERLGARLTKTGSFQTVLATVSENERYDVMAVCEDSRGRIWLGTAQHGLFYWQNGKLTKFPDPALDTLATRAIAEDRHGRIWVGTQMGLLCYDSDFKKLPLPFPWYETRALLVDREGSVWAGTSGGGLFRYLDGISSQIQKTDGLADDFISSLAEDSEGSLWVGTRNGLSQLSDVKIPTLGKSEGLTADVNVGVYPSRKGGIWVATDKGFTYFDGTAHSYSADVGLKNPYITRILETRNGDLYLADGSKGIEVVSGGKIVATYTNQTWPTAMTEDARGAVVAVGSELFRAGTNYFVPYPFADGKTPPFHWVFNMTTGRDGSIWIASHEGICRVREDGTYKLWRRGVDLPEAKALWVCEDSHGVLWAGLETGLARLKDGRIRVATTEDGLFDNIINTIVQDDRGNLWVDSSRGFFSVSLRSLNDWADRKINQIHCVGFDGLDAIKSSEKYQQQPSGCKTPDGKIWFPTAQGIVMIDPTNLSANPFPPIVHIDQGLANGRELEESGAVVAPGKGDLEFHYAGLSYIAPLKTQYRYRLYGYDKGWVDAGVRRAAFYTNLKPGEYQFAVQACNEDGVWSTTGASFAVELQPHYFQTVWFYLLCAALTFAGLVGTYAWRVRHLRRRQKALQQTRDLLEVKVAERTAALAEANVSLTQEIHQRVGAQAELEEQKATLEKEIEERKRMEVEVEHVHRQLIDASRQAGQAEVASGVLHNVGNVLNSVNVSTTLISDRLRNMQITDLAKAADLMQEHNADLGRFLSADERGRKLPGYLGKFARYLGQEKGELLTELKELADNVEHIKEIVAMQQTYATVSGVSEKAQVSELVEAALKMHSAAYVRHSVKVVREYDTVPTIIVDRHKVLQILINILHNAKYACDAGNPPEKKVIVRIKPGGRERVVVEMADNGIGIAPENLIRIFSHGFTTRKNGHGFGLHSAALAAKELGGCVRAQSAGPGKGATFIVEFPIRPAAERTSENSPELVPSI